MSKINILTKEIYNKIAAGEVVEKPASVVKELVENSIDAGATNIVIEILEGGIKYMKVSDNGSGIDYDDYDKVFLAHATSKVKTVDDLSSIGTLGFRGEALSSIASVSNITLASKIETASEGYQIKLSGGDIVEDVTPIGATTGTYITVSDLFFNIPARKKFLRKPKLEENDITNYVARLILANPNISIKYVADNKIVYHSYGTGLYDAIYSIYGKSIVDNIFEVNFERGDFKFSGFLGKPTFSKPNRTYQTLVINGRYVINQTISTSIYKAYDNFLMKGTFPFFVLHLQIPLDKVDVNVHPNKLEVKFEDSNTVFGLVYSEILNILYGVNSPKKINNNDSLDDNIQVVDVTKLVDVKDCGSEYSIDNKQLDAYQTNNTANIFSNDINDQIIEVSLTDTVQYETNKANQEIEDFKKNVKDAENEGFKLVPYITNSTFDFHVNQNKATSDNLLTKDPDNIINNFQEEEKFEKFEKLNTTQNSFINDNNFEILGALFNTYIIIEKENKLLLIDQHAAHERLLFDKFNLELKNKQIAIQPLMIPFILETNYNESNFIIDNLDLLHDLGFEIETFGDNSFKVSSVPLLFDNINLTDFFDLILKDIDNKLIVSNMDNLKDYLAKKACRSAVKGNDKLDTSEISVLINDLFIPEQVLLCPHGRPIIVEISKKDIEKWFKRIV